MAKQILAAYPNHKIFCFEGNLGAGKTTLIEALCRALGSNDSLSSPTFSIINEYQIPKGLIIHSDWYRLKNIEELLDIGMEDYLHSDNYCMIEWHQIGEPILPRPYLLISINTLEDISRTLAVQSVE